MNNVISKPEEDEKLARIFKAVAEPTRLQMLRLLKIRGTELNISEFDAVIDKSFSTLAAHAKLLHQADLILTHKVGRDKFVYLNKPVFDEYLPGLLERL